MTLAGAILAVAFAGGLVAPAWGQAPCQLPDNGGGTVDLPPAGCGYVSPNDLHKMIDGLPPGTEIRVSAEHNEFFNVTRHPGGSFPGGEVENFNSFLLLHLQGTGSMAGYSRTVSMQAMVETHVAQHTPGASVQSFDTQMQALQGQLPPGDPDFDLLIIRAGNAFGMPSPGHTTLTRMPNGNYNVDSFFDVFYEIEFTGAPGGPFGGMHGSTTGTIRMQSGQPAPNPLPCVVPDAGGTVNLPPQGCGYVSPQDLHQILNGLPPGTVINIGAEHERFFNITTQPGGSLGGEIETFSSELHLSLNGGGLNRMMTLPVQCQTHVGPRTPGDPVQSFDTVMFGMQGEITGDPDFDLLRIRGGNSFGMPSPGHTTLTRLPGGNWNVDSFFDITYRIDFVGAPGGPLAGMSGSTTATIKMATGQPKTTQPTCFNPDNGSGTVNLPPAGCGYLSPADVHQILQGLPAGTQVNFGVQHARFFNVNRSPGGQFGPQGEIEQFGSQLTLNMQGEDILPGFSRILSLPVQCEAHTGPRPPGPNQSFPNDMFRLEGQLPPGDPDFDLLRVEGGTFYGMPSPGHTTLTLQPGGSWAVDSFFDVFYEIDFIGAPGGHLSGMSGSTTATIRMSATQEVFPPVGTPSLTLDQFPSSTQLTWSTIPNATHYDVVCGSLDTLRATLGDFTMATTMCLVNDQPSTSTVHAPNPPVGSGLWCVVRGVNIVGFGSYDEGGNQVGSRNAEILASGLGCP